MPNEHLTGQPEIAPPWVTAHLKLRKEAKAALPENPAEKPELRPALQMLWTWLTGHGKR